MRKKYSLVLAIALLGASPGPRIYLGVQGMIAAGAHTDIAGKQSGVAGGALLQFGVRGKRAGLHVEGIPPVGLPQAPSGYYGQATPQLSLLNGAFEFAVDPRARWWLGAGMTVINQRTPLPNLSQVVTSRLSGARYELSYRLPIGPSRFAEFTIGGAPHLTGVDHYTYSVPSPEVDKPEVAAEEDGMFAYGVTRGNTQWLVGFRSINFSARYVLTGAAADRNNGAGPLLEWRQYVR
ncbi:MAG TPA: hypothetical protein VFN37_11205 [Candidatus Baltobacteraceae bacterium]|nr:hypothetical protein [Candidatus Baltobacteraceae bacterium]